jgi:serine/threonine protein kinase
MKNQSSACSNKDLERRPHEDLEQDNDNDNDNNSDTGCPDTKAALNYAKHAPFAGQAALEELEKLQASSLLTITETTKTHSRKTKPQPQPQPPKPVAEESSSILSLKKSDIRIERLLGQGNYASVFLVAVPQLGSQPQYDDDDYLSEVSMDFSERGSLLDDTYEHSVAGFFAMKRLRLDYDMDIHTNINTNKENLKDATNLNVEKDFLKAARDLVNEAFVLSQLQHENLVQLRGVAVGNHVDTIHAAFQQPGGYFLILEALEQQQTLDVILHQWREMDHLPTRGFFFFPPKQKKDKNTGIPSWQYRIRQMALQICKGMEYLHQRHVMFRDLKPHNIGMGQDGKMKIFDFGVARQVPPPPVIPGQKRQQQHVMIEGTAGSFRYMAPENMLGHGCFFAGDVYSFGVLLWELLSLDIAFEHMSASTYQVEVCSVEGYRPNIRRVGAVPKSVKVLIQDCWDDDRSVRPTFSEVREVLESVPQKQMQKQKRGEAPRSPRLGRGPLRSMFRLPGSTTSRTTTKTKTTPLEAAVSSVGVGPSKR